MLVLEGGRSFIMNQKKIGGLLKELRKEKGLTQEQFAEMLKVSNRTVSRWENGYNLPDLDILITIADYYEVELRELLEGERKSENMNKDLEETILKSVDYTNTQIEKYTKKIHWLLSLGAILWFIAQMISHTSLDEIVVLCNFSDFAEGVAAGMMIICILLTSKYGDRLKKFKQRLIKREL